MSKLARQPSRFRRSILEDNSSGINPALRHDTYQQLTNHRSVLPVTTRHSGAKILAADILTQAIIDILGPKTTDRNRNTALLFFACGYHNWYLQQLGLPLEILPQAIMADLIEFVATKPNVQDAHAEIFG